MDVKYIAIAVLAILVVGLLMFSTTYAKNLVAEETDKGILQETSCNSCCGGQCDSNCCSNGVCNRASGTGTSSCGC